jgi:hypothetical protein
MRRIAHHWIVSLCVRACMHDCMCCGSCKDELRTGTHPYAAQVCMPAFWLVTTGWCIYVQVAPMLQQYCVPEMSRCVCDCDVSFDVCVRLITPCHYHHSSVGVLRHRALWTMQWFAQLMAGECVRDDVIAITPRCVRPRGDTHNTDDGRRRSDNGECVRGIVQVCCDSHTACVASTHLPSLAASAHSLLRHCCKHCTTRLCLCAYRCVVASSCVCTHTASQAACTLGYYVDEREVAPLLEPLVAPLLEAYINVSVLCCVVLGVVLLVRVHAHCVQKHTNSPRPHLR